MADTETPTVITNPAYYQNNQWIGITLNIAGLTETATCTFKLRATIGGSGNL